MSFAEDFGEEDEEDEEGEYHASEEYAAAARKRHQLRYSLSALTKDFPDLEFSKDCSMTCLLYTSPSPRDATLSRMPSSA